MQSLYHQVEGVLNALPEDNTIKRYRLVNSVGQYFSMHDGWRMKSGDIKGHIFSKNEAKTLRDWLISQGEQDITIKHDLIGTLFMLSISGK